ncbi:hypothetical protein F2P56_033898 [Juglans regia]|uniref:Uncharacterized protein n=1 Tax=Juglans regia TaxID=51240 RepID=A0A833TX78_JUGRE|nr:hypothetical protein F2P56_033898 [Juglans regia]
MMFLRSMVDPIPGFDIFPDDVVGIIGQKHFWKSRRAIVNQPSSYGAYIGNSLPAPVATDNKMGPWCINQSLRHQWLIPIVSPSEGLVYKPYPGPGFMGTAYGGCGPFSQLVPLTGNLMNSAYWFPGHPSHHGIGNPPGTPLVGHTYFPTHGMPVMHPTMSGSAVEQVNQSARLGSHGQSQLSGGGANLNMQHQTSHKPERNL